MHQVFLKDIETQSVKKLFAAKIVFESYILQHTKRRRSNLMSEIELLSTADCNSSVKLIELILTEPHCTIIIQDYANGGSLFDLMETRMNASKTLKE